VRVLGEHYFSVFFFNYLLLFLPQNMLFFWVSISLIDKIFDTEWDLKIMKNMSNFFFFPFKLG
jgi:hypothetical protein